MLSVLLELQRLKRLDRTGWVLRGLAPGAESVGAHTYGVAAVAMLLADEIQARGGEVNVERVLRLALVHDWTETRMGDLPRTAADYFGAAAKQRAERAAFADMVADLGPERARAYAAWHEEYETRASLEARLVKAADIVDLLAQAFVFERAGARELGEFWQDAEARDFGLEGVAAAVVRELVAALVAARAQLEFNRSAAEGR
ncbi:MAG TPA: HD family hydrolase [Pyrinomonadaceae bacterium]|jgi:putative hydrolase of HD superfamily